MDATQIINDHISESDEEEYEEENEDNRGQPLAKLRILKNEHIPETELPLFLGDNVLGRDPNTCTLLLSAPSISKQHATICISVYRRKGCHTEMDIEALVWDLGSMNGTRKGRLKLTPEVRYSLSDGDSLVVADIPCQYVSCAVNAVSSQRNLRTPMSRKSLLKAGLPDASGKKGGDTSTGSKNRVNGGTKSGVSLAKTPVRTSCLSFEQTPTQPQGTLVPKSDSESEDERWGGGPRMRKTLVSDSDSHKSSPTCSTFLSPISKIVPESEDESPITPSSSTKNRHYSDVSLSKEETEVNMDRQQLMQNQAFAIIVDNSEEEQGREKERVTSGVIEDDKNGQRVPAKQARNVIPTENKELPVCTSDVSTHAVPAFNMDSDTDEEGLVSAGPVTLNTNQVNQPPTTDQFRMDSDTDVEEDEDALEKAPKTVPSSDDNIKSSHVISVIQPEGVTVDSGTDVDDDAAVSDATTKAKPLLFQSACTADYVPLMQPKDFCLDSDTDVDEEEEAECGKDKSISKPDTSHTRLDIKAAGPDSTYSAPHGLHLDSDKVDEVIPTPAVSEPSMMFGDGDATESCTTADRGTNILNILPDSDTDVEDDSPLVIPVPVTTLSVSSTNMPEALQSDSDAETDLDESNVPPAGGMNNPADLRMDSGTDEPNIETGDGQIPDLCREQTPGFLLPLLQNCSTPVQVSEGEVENMEALAFLSPSSVPVRCVAAPVVALSSCSDSQAEEDFVVAETQSFILQTRDCQDNPSGDHTVDNNHSFGLEPSDDEKYQQSSNGRSFQLGLSDSSYLQCQAQDLARESTQTFVLVDRNVNLEETQAYASISTADRATGEKATNLQATQAYGVDEEPDRCSVMSEKEDQEHMALEATQAYISEPYSDSENETDEPTSGAETQASDFPPSSSLAMAETQPMSAFEEKESLATDEPVVFAQLVNPKTQNVTEERLLSETLSVAKTQPMQACEDEESNDEHSVPETFTNTELSAFETQPMVAVEDRGSDEDLNSGLRKRKAKPLQLEEEQTQPLANFELSVVETQPMHIGIPETQPIALSGTEESNVELEEEKAPMLINSELSTVETQPMDRVEESEEEDSIPVSLKRRAKPLQLEETQTLSNPERVCVFETQPMGTCEDEESSDEDSFPGLHKRKAKPLQLEDEQTQSLTNSEVETQPTVMVEDEESSNEKSLITKSDVQPERVRERQSEPGTSGVTLRNKRETGEKLREEEQEKCSDPQKTKRRGKNKALPSNRGRRGKSRLDEDESEEEEEVEQAKRARGKSYVSQQKDKEEEEQFEAEGFERVESNNDRMDEKKDVANLRQQGIEKMEKEIGQVGERQREQEQIEGQHRAEQEQLERERKVVEEQERLYGENAERKRLEEEKERKKHEENERYERIRKAKEQLERETRENEERERIACEKTKREEKDKLMIKEKAENERKEREEKEKLETEKRKQEESLERERKEQEHQARLEREEIERLEKEKETKENQIEEQQKNKVPTRGRRAARRTIGTLPEQDSTISTNDDVPARRTRSRSNSSNSVSSERSASSLNIQVSRGRGRGRGVKRASEPPQAATARSSNRRRTVAADNSQQDSNNISLQRLSPTTNSPNSLNSDISSCSPISQTRGRGVRQRGRGRKTEPYSIPALNNQSDQNSASQPAARGRKSRRAEGSSNEEEKEQADSQQASTTRVRQRASTHGSESAAADEEDQSNQEGCHANEKSPMTKRNVRGRGQKAVKSEILETPGVPAVCDGAETKDKKIGTKRELVQTPEEDSSGSSKIFRRNEKPQQTDAPEEERKHQIKDENPVQAKRRGRAASAQAKKNAKEPPAKVEVKVENENMELETVRKRARGRPSAVQKKQKEEQEDNSETSVSSMSQDANVVASQPQTPTSSVSRKRQTSVDSCPMAKTPRSSASPVASGRLQKPNQGYKVLFTGVVDEAGERVLTRLGGSMAEGVADMNCLVTDKVRRTVKFLCAVAKGIPIVTTHWLEKSGKAGSFLPPNAFVVKDPEQEKKFSFSLQESLRTASSRPLLQGYQIHVTKSVKPEPVHMKDIISCSGATFLPKMPSSPKLQTVVISCEEDWPQCRPAVSASLPVVSAEFVLTGILQQKLDFQTHTLSAPASSPQPAGGKGRSRKKT